MNETLNTIMTRKSVRSFTEEKVSDEDIRTILKAGMSGPSACNCRPWSFIVLQDRDVILKAADLKGKYSNPLRSAAFGVLVCGDMSRALERAPEYWVIDGSIAIQNMILAAESMGIGSVWLGVWPQQERVEGLAKGFDLPEGIVPHSLVAFGYAADGQNFGTPIDKPEWDEDRVHYDKW